MGAVVGISGRAAWESASTNRRKESDFVVSGERRGPRGELLIAGRDEGRAKTGEGRMGCRVTSEERFDRGACSDIHGIFGAADDFFDSAEEENFDADG